MEAKTEGLESDKLQAAMQERPDYEADKLAQQIIAGTGGAPPRHSQNPVYAVTQGRAGYQHGPYVAQNQGGNSPNE